MEIFPPKSEAVAFKGQASIRNKIVIDSTIFKQVNRPHAWNVKFHSKRRRIYVKKANIFTNYKNLDNVLKPNLVRR
jgi:hypothetical protein